MNTILLTVARNCSKFLAFAFALTCFLMNGDAKAQNKSQANDPYWQILQKQVIMTAHAGNGENFQTRIENPKTKLTASDAGNDRGNGLSDFIKHERDMLLNPETKKMPAMMRMRELNFTKGISGNLGGPRLMMAASANAKSSGGQTQVWKERGPYNVGGRTRALAIDLNNEKIILAGGITGGIWRTDDSGQKWVRVTRRNDISSVTYVVQDPRPGHRNIWYYGTGELIGSSESGNSTSIIQGNGIFKSTDGGHSFSVLSSTVYGSPTVATPFSFIFSLAVNPLNGDLLVGSAKGIFRSTDGGDSFTQLLDAASDNLLHIAEVIFTPKGVLYASVSHGGHPNRGVFQSLDGGDSFKNITPVNFPSSYGRIVMGYAPQKEEIVYFYGYNPTIDSAFLFKYNFNRKINTSDNWYDYTANLPKLGGNVGNLDVQTGYDMVVKVFPTDTNEVFICGTNIYRSNTGFSKPIALSDWIGGYSSANDVSKYTNHHPDQHQLIFFPSDPKKVLTSNDGGVQVTSDILGNSGKIESVSWTSLDNGYYTSQPYQVTFDPFGTSTNLIAGFQDNGSWSSSGEASISPWSETGPGDGGFAGLYDGGKTRYVSFNYGNIYRLTYPAGSTDGGQPATVTYLSPTATGSTTGFAQIPFYTFDENNKQVMYLPQANFLWRNLHLDKIPVGNPNPTSIYWTKLKGTILKDSNSYVTAVVTSRTAPSNRLYFGSSSGGIFKIDNSNIGDKPGEDISTGKNLPAGYVSSLTVDPADGDRVFAVFSNYGIKSVFYSKNAGKSWISISGNLEEFPDGSGDGPSVRWISILGNSDRYIVGTSTGLYYTTKLAGDGTKWIQDSKNTIGDDIIPYIKTRDDGYIALAAHGNGMFDAKLPVTKIPSPTLILERNLYDLAEIVGGPPIIYDLNTIFKTTDNKPFHVDFYDSDTSLITVRQEGHYAYIRFKGRKLGTATIGMIASRGKEVVSTGFDISVAGLASANLLYSQYNNPGINYAYSQNFPDINTTWQSSDDFFVPKGQTWNIDHVLAVGAESNAGTIFKSINVIIYADSMGKPGKILRTEKGLFPIDDTTSTNLNVKLGKPLALMGGHYWISVYPDLNIISSTLSTPQLWGWATQMHEVGSRFLFKRVKDAQSGVSGWISDPMASLLNADTTANYDLSFFLYGSASHVTPPAAPTKLIASIVNDAEIDLSWVSNSTNERAFKIERSIDGIHFTKVTLVDGGVTTYQDLNKFDRKNDYYYRVNALGIDSNSAFSNIVQVKFKGYPGTGEIHPLSVLTKIKVFSNPNVGLFKVFVPVEVGDVYMTLYNTQGIKLQTIGRVKNGQTISINITNLDNATYILKVEKQQESQSFYVVKK